MTSVTPPADNFESGFERIETRTPHGTIHIRYRLTDAEREELCAARVPDDAQMPEPTDEERKWLADVEREWRDKLYAREPAVPDVADDWPLEIAPFGGEDPPLVPYLLDVTGMTNAEAALAYARAGIAIVPVRPGTKNPGSYLGQGWPRRATCGLDTVRDWWRRWPDAGMAMHVGGSLLLVIDVDNPDDVPNWLWKLLEHAVFRPTTNDPHSRRGHYFYRLKAGERFSNGLGGLKPPKGKSWGEARCWGGAIVLGPTAHPRAAEGGRYGTGGADEIPLRPDEIADKLNAAPIDEYRPIAAGELDENARRFLATYTDDKEPDALAPILADFDPEPGGRHASMWSTQCWALREAKAGCFPAVRAVEKLKGLWETAIGGAYRHSDPDEFNRMLRDAVFAADADGTVEELWDRAHRNLWPAPGDAFQVAGRFVEIAEVNRAPLRSWNGLWFAWIGTHYRRLITEDLRDDLYGLLGYAYYVDADGNFRKWMPNQRKLNDVIDAARGLVKLPADTQAASWLDGLHDEGVIPCANGLLRIADPKRPELLKHTPDYFNLFSLPYGYDPDATCPRWMQFLNEVFGNDTQSVELLQEWFIYVLSGRTDLHKMFMWIGPKRGGKGTVARLMKQLIGAAAYAGLMVTNLKSNFVLQDKIDKSLVVFPDERQVFAPDGKHLVQFILETTGEDDVHVDIKHRPPWNGRLPLRLMYMGNEMPVLPDASGAVLSRLLVINTTVTFAGREDRKLEGSLVAELPGILNWALGAQDRLQKRGEFIQPQSGAELLADIDAYSNPMRSFLADYCVLANGEKTDTQMTYQEFDLWCRRKGIESRRNSVWFGRQLRPAMRDLAPEVKFERKQSGSRPDRNWYYHGIGLPAPAGGPRIKTP